MVANCNCFFFLLRLDSVGRFCHLRFHFSFVRFSYDEIPLPKLILYLIVPFVVVANFLLTGNVFPVNLSEPKKAPETKKELDGDIRRILPT